MSEGRKSSSTIATVILNAEHDSKHHLAMPKAHTQESQSSQVDAQGELILSRANLHRTTVQVKGMGIDSNKKQDVATNVDNNGYFYDCISTPTPKGAALDIDFFVYYYVVNDRTIVGRYNDIERALSHLSMFGNNIRNQFTKRSRRALIPVFFDAPSHPYSLLSNGFISQFLHKKNSASSRANQTITNADQVRKTILKSLSCCYWETEKELAMMTKVVENEHKILFPAIHSTSSMRLHQQQRRSGGEITVQDVIIDMPPSNKGRRTKESFTGGQERFREALRRKTLQVCQEAHVVSRAMSGRENLHIIFDSEDE